MDNLLILRGRLELVDQLAGQAFAAYASSLRYQIKGKVRFSLREREKSRELDKQVREWTDKTLAPLYQFFN